MRHRNYRTIYILTLVICGNVYVTLDIMCPLQKLYKSMPDIRKTTKVKQL